MRGGRWIPAAGATLALSLVIAAAHHSLQGPPPDAGLDLPEAPAWVATPASDAPVFEPDTDDGDEAPAPPARGEEPGREIVKGKISGTLLLADGTPVPGAEVRCEEVRSGEKIVHAVVETDGYGRFEASVPKGVRYRVVAAGSLPGGGRIQAPGYRTSPGRTGITLTATPADPLSGRVADESGCPLADVVIEAEVGKPRARQTWVGRTDADGRYEVFIPRGKTTSLRVYVETTDDAGMPYVRGYRSGLAGGETADFTLRPGKEISGRVLSPTGGSATGIPLRAHQALGSHPMVVRARTNAFGEFRIGGLFDMQYRIEIDRKRHEGTPVAFSGSTNVKAGATDVRLELVEVGRASGTLYRPSGEPARRWSFWLVHDVTGKRLSCRTGKDGAFKYTTLPFGSYAAWTNYTVNGKRNVLECGRLTSGDEGVVLRIPRP